MKGGLRIIHLWPKRLFGRVVEEKEREIENNLLFLKNIGKEIKILSGVSEVLQSVRD